jgi:hypothetical protein
MSAWNDWITLAPFTPGRALYALDRMAQSATVQAQASLAADVTRAQAAAAALDEVEARWRTRKALSKARGNAVEIDAVLDRLLTAIYQQLRTRLGFLPAADANRRAAEAFLLKQLPQGSGPVTLLPFEEELAVLQRVLKAFEAPEGQALQRSFELGGLVSQMAAEVPRFAAELARTQPETIAFDAVRAARANLQRALARLVARCVADLGDEADAERLAEVLDPLAFQQERLRTLRASRRRLSDINPLTGDEEPTSGDEPEA